MNVSIVESGGAFRRKRTLVAGIDPIQRSRPSAQADRNLDGLDEEA